MSGQLELLGMRFFEFCLELGVVVKLLRVVFGKMSGMVEPS